MYAADAAGKGAVVKGLKIPAVDSLWRDRARGTAYRVRSVDERGVFLKQVVMPGFCRLPLGRFAERFEAVDAGQGRQDAGGTENPEGKGI